MTKFIYQFLYRYFHVSNIIISWKKHEKTRKTRKNFQTRYKHDGNPIHEIQTRTSSVKYTKNRKHEIYKKSELYCRC